MDEQAGCKNTDRELWRAPDDGRFFADSIFVTEDGGIGMNVGGHVIVKPIKDWVRLASRGAGWRYDKELRTLVPPDMTPKTRRHTPGPWHFDQNRDEVTVYADNDWPVARLLEMGDTSNAQLIAAAPDMLAALKMCVIERSEWLAEARTAIAKAEGTS